MRLISALLALWLLLGASGCVLTSRTDHRSAPSQKPSALPSVGEVWYSTSAANSPALLRSSTGQSAMPGDKFEFSDDGAYVAVTSGDALAVASMSDRKTTVVNPKVLSFRWRRGSHDLLFLVRDVEKPQRARWYLRKENGDVSLLTESGLTSLLTATTSPDGAWLAYYYLQTLVAVPLAGGKPHTFPLQETESAPIPKWAGSDYLSIRVGTRLELMRVPSGERSTVADVGAEFSSYPVWTRDGSTVAVETRAGISVFRDGRLQVECQGPWSPMAWSPDGRYLMMDGHGNVRTTMGMHLLDMHKQGACEPMQMPAARTVEAWHPSLDRVLMSTSTSSQDPGDLLVWDLTSDKAILAATVGHGTNGRWVGPQSPSH